MLRNLFITVVEGGATTIDGCVDEHPLLKKYIVYRGQINEIVNIYISLHTLDVSRASSSVIKIELEALRPEVDLEGSILDGFKFITSLFIRQNSLNILWVTF